MDSCQDANCDVDHNRSPTCTARGSCGHASRPGLGPVSSSNSLCSLTSSGACASQGTLLEHVIHHINEGILVADPHQAGMPFVYVSDAFLQLTGYNRHEVLGTSWPLLLGPGTHPAVLMQFQSALSGAQDVSVEVLTQKKDGSTFWNLLSLTHIVDSSSGELLHVVAVQRDISDVKHWQQAERQLHQERAAAAAAQEARNRFLATMSHELRTPLNGILASAQLLIASQLSPEQRELAETIFDSSNALLGTLADILDFSVLNEGPEGALPLRKEPVCLQHALEGVAEMVAPTAAAKGLQLCVLVDQALWGRHFVGDATRVRQVIHQLVSNAVKFTERGQVLVHAQLVTSRTAGLGSHGSGGSLSLSSCCSSGAGTRSESSEMRRDSIEQEAQQQQQQQQEHKARPLPARLPPGLYIHIHDSGIGISPAQLPHLFDCFKQAHGDTMSRKYGGTGLGLALSKRLAEAMHGDIFISSIPQQGSQFTFALHPVWCVQQLSQAVGLPVVPRMDAAAVPAADAGCNGGDEGPPESTTPTAASTDIRLSRSLFRYNVADAASGPELQAIAEQGGMSGSSGSSGATPKRDAVEAPVTPQLAAQAGGAGALASSYCVEGYAHSCGSSWYDGEVDTGRCYQCFPHHKEELDGRRVAVDVRHPAIAAQACQLLQQLGLKVCKASSSSMQRRSSTLGPLPGVGLCEEEGPPLGAAGGSPVAASLGLLFNKVWSGDAAIRAWLEEEAPHVVPPAFSQLGPTQGIVSKPYESSLYSLTSSSSSSSRAADPPPTADVALVSSCRLAAALRSGWKGRPLLVLGDPQEVPEKLHPLVVMVSNPLKLGKLAAALSKAAAMLSWSGGLQPRLGRLALSMQAAGLALGAGGAPARRGHPAAARMPGATAAAAVGLDAGDAGDMFVRRASIDNSALVKRAAGKPVLARPAAAPAAGQGSPLAGASTAAGAVAAAGDEGFLPAAGTVGVTGNSSEEAVQAPTAATTTSSREGAAEGRCSTDSSSSASSAGSGGSDAAPGSSRRSVKQMLSSAAVVAITAAAAAAAGFKQQRSADSVAGSSSRGAGQVLGQQSPAVTPSAVPTPHHHQQQQQQQPPQETTSVCGPDMAPQSLGASCSSQPGVISLTASSGSTAAPAAALYSPIGCGAAMLPPAAGVPGAMAAGVACGTQGVTGSGPLAAPGAPVSWTAAAAVGAGSAAGVKAPAAARPSPPAPIAGKAPKILIAEDNRVNQVVVLKVLQTLLRGCRPDVVENGLQVLRALERQRYDLILMDIHMPEMDGLEASQRIQQLYEPSQRPRIIALSADTLTALREQCAAAGIEEFISKPFRVEDLRRVVASLATPKEACVRA